MESSKIASFKERGIGKSLKKKRGKGTIVGGLDKARYVRIEGGAKFCGRMAGAEGPSKGRYNWILRRSEGGETSGVEFVVFSFPLGSMKISKWTAKTMRPRHHFPAIGNNVTFCTAITLEMKYKVLSPRPHRLALSNF